jgi:glycosyltransferase involved in cell wall biosynthesis
VTNYYPDQRPLSEYGFHLARGLRESNRGHVSVLSGRAPAPPNGAWRVWTYGRVSIPFEIQRALRKVPHDAVLFNTIFSNWGGTLTNMAGMLAPMIARRAGMTVITLLHHLPQTIDTPHVGYRMTPAHVLAIELACRAVAMSDVVCFTTRHDLTYFQGRYRPRHVRLVPLGLQGPTAWVPPPTGPARILAFGKWGRGKDPQPAIRAFLRSGIDGELVIAGGSSPTRPGFIEALAARYAAEHVIFTGYVPEVEVAPLFQSAHVVVFPYRATTGLSAVLHQACQFGRVPVLRRLPMFEQIVRDLGLHAFFYDTEDELASLLPTILEHRQELEVAGLHNLRAVQRQTMDRVGDLYWRLLDERNGRGNGY